MKKNVKIIAVLSLLLCSIFFMGCGTKVKGTNWKATDASLADNANEEAKKQYEVIKPTISMINTTISFGEDDSVTMNVLDNSVTGTYVQSGKEIHITADGETMTSTILSDKLILNLNGINLIFTLQKE